MQGERIDAIITREARATAALAALSAPTRSRRHGHQPAAAAHVELYLAVEALGLSPADLCRSDHRHRSTVYRSIERGRRLCALRRRRPAPATGRRPRCPVTGRFLRVD